MDLALHGTDDQLELYALGRLSVADLPVIEEHLMVCAACRERLDQIDYFAAGMRDALSMTAEPVAAPSRDWFSPAMSWIRKPVFSMALGFAALIAVIGVFSNGRPQLAPVATLQLTAMRGETPSAAPAREVDLTLVDAPQGGGPFRIEVIGAAGQAEWSGLADSGPKGVEVRVQRRLGPGNYFVRLYNAQGNLLHEYGFMVRQ